MSKEPKIVTFDIETTPVTAYTWDLYPNFLSHDNIVEDWSIICAAWKYVGKDKVHTAQIKTVHDDCDVVLQLRNVLEDADIVVGHNIDKFDVRKLNARLAFHGLPPLPKLKTVDTRKVAKAVGGFTSNRLDYLGKFLLGEGKMEVHYDLWLKIMKGSKSALKEMVDYNKIDVVRNEQLYLKLRPYMHNHPHMGVLNGKDKIACPSCGSEHTQKRGTAITASGGVYQRLQCQACGGWHQVTMKKIKK